MDNTTPDVPFWKTCNTCKKPISFKGVYYVCSVSTCRAKRTSFVFCTVSCWDGHIGMFNHRNAFAEEEIAPAA
jgi:hypothetical protein